MEHERLYFLIIGSIKMGFTNQFNFGMGVGDWDILKFIVL